MEPLRTDVNVEFDKSNIGNTERDGRGGDSFYQQLMNFDEKSQVRRSTMGVLMAN
jgi:hypothetical protein